MLFCMYILFTMHAYMYSSLYTYNCTVLYSTFFSENKNVNVNVNINVNGLYLL